MSYLFRDTKTNHLLWIDRIVVDMSVKTFADPVSNIHVASEFEDLATAKDILKELAETYDTSNVIIMSREEIENELQQDEINERRIKRKNQWATMSLDQKKSTLYRVKKSSGQEGVNEYLDDVEDTSGITPYTFDEIIDKDIKGYEEQLGITFTDEQKQQIHKKRKGDNDGN